MRCAASGRRPAPADAEKALELRLQEQKAPLALAVEALTAAHRRREFLRVELFLKAAPLGPAALAGLAFLADRDRSYEAASALFDVLVQRRLSADTVYEP